MNIVLIGPSGGGKGTLAAALAARFHLATFDTGARLRAVAQEPTPLGEALRHELGQGKMAPPGLVVEILTETVRTVPAGCRGWLIDGTPRTLDQAQFLVRQSASGALPLDLVAVLDAPQSLLEARLAGRRLCDRCGTIYHTETAPPPSATHCTPACGGRIVTRKEDTPEGIATRFAWYASETIPAIAHLEAARLPVFHVDAAQSREAVLAAVTWVLASAEPVPGGGRASGLPRRSRTRVG